MIKRRVRLPYFGGVYGSLFTVFFEYFITIFSLLLLLPADRLMASAFCHPGCRCADELMDVECHNISSIPILFHPMLRSLTVRDSPSLVLDSVSIGLYQELELLDLSNNGVYEIPDGFFSGLRKLRALNLRSNKLKIFDPRHFGLAHRHHASNIQTLDISDNQLERIVHPSKLESSVIPALASLNFSGNRLHQLEDALSGQPVFGAWAQNLKKLDLSGNRVAKLSADGFKALSALEYLDLSENILSELPNGFLSSQVHLKHLNLARNLIANNIDENAFLGIKQLRDLNLAGCMISNLSSLRLNWRHFPALARLTLSSNALLEIPKLAFDGLYGLEELAISDMPQFTTVKNFAFGGLISLKSLVLSDCPLLDSLPSKMFGERNSALALPPTNLKRLDLSNNALSTLSVAMLEDNWSQLDTLKLFGNRWRCDCALLEFLPRAILQAKARSNTNHSGNAFTAFCTEPEPLFNQKIEDIKDTSYCASSTRSGAPLFALFTVAAAVLAALTTLMAVTALFCCCCWRYHYGTVQKSRANRSSYHSHHHSNALAATVGKSTGKQSSNLFYRFIALPFFRRCHKSNNSTSSTTIVKGIMVNASSASTSSSSTSSSSSYCNRISSRDACAPLYNGTTTALSESLYYDRATEPFDTKSAKDFTTTTVSAYPPQYHRQSTTKLLGSAINNASLPHYSVDMLSGAENGGSDYYSCIPTSNMMETSTVDYCLPPPAGYCTHQRGSCYYAHNAAAAQQRISNSNSQQILISYGADSIAYPPYLYHSKSNYGGIHTVSNHPPHCYSTDCNDTVENVAANDSGCCGCNSTNENFVVDMMTNGMATMNGAKALNNGITVNGCCQPTATLSRHFSTNAAQLPAFIAPPPPSTIPPPPNATQCHPNTVVDKRRNNDIPTC